MIAHMTQKRFFSSVTSYFDKTYAGRYFAVVLAELARIEPKAFLQILEAAGLELLSSHADALLAGDIVVDLEWWFEAIFQPLAVLDGRLPIGRMPVISAQRTGPTSFTTSISRVLAPYD
jgi:hypothetical protein